jgi:hypothetical protein
VDPDKVKAIVEMEKPDDIYGIRRFLQQYLSNSAIKVVSGRNSVAKLVCQNDEFASSLENTTAYASLAKDSSTEGSGQFSRFIIR